MHFTRFSFFTLKIAFYRNAVRHILTVRAMPPRQKRSVSDALKCFPCCIDIWKTQIMSEKKTEERESKRNKTKSKLTRSRYLFKYKWADIAALKVHSKWKLMTLCIFSVSLEHFSRCVCACDSKCTNRRNANWNKTNHFTFNIFSTFISISDSDNRAYMNAWHAKCERTRERERSLSLRDDHDSWAWCNFCWIDFPQFDAN